jgi:hypothetical protein
MNYIIYDLEFNQSLRSKDTNENLKQEIIQIGAIKTINHFFKRDSLS